MIDGFSNQINKIKQELLNQKAVHESGDCCFLKGIGKVFKQDQRRVDKCKKTFHLFIVLLTYSGLLFYINATIVHLNM